MRQFSIGFLVKVMKVSSSEVIEKKCPGLVSILLEGLSTHEVGGEQLNYLSQHSESMQRSKEEIDNLRVCFDQVSVPFVLTKLIFPIGELFQGFPPPRGLVYLCEARESRQC